MIVDHFGFSVADYEVSKAFYLAALAPMGIGLVMEVPGEGGPIACGFGRDGKPEFWIGGEGKTTPRIHIAFAARSRSEVDAFYKAALAAGGVDHGEPGIRPHYHPNYYGAFVLDPDGNNVEAVCHKPA